MQELDFHSFSQAAVTNWELGFLLGWFTFIRTAPLELCIYSPVHSTSDWYFFQFDARAFRSFTLVEVWRRTQPKMALEKKFPFILYCCASGFSPSAFLVIKPNETQHSAPLSMSCEVQGNSSEWRIRWLSKRQEVLDCPDGWIAHPGPICRTSCLDNDDSGVYWCESESGDHSNAVNITVIGECTSIIPYVNIKYLHSFLLFILWLHFVLESTIILFPKRSPYSTFVRGNWYCMYSKCSRHLLEVLFFLCYS